MKAFKLAIAGTLLMSAALLSCTETPVAQPCTITPRDFCEPFEKLRERMPESDREALKVAPENGLAKFHFNVGMAARNDLGLWQDNPISRFFKQNGADHPDEMSYIVLIALHRWLNGQPVDMEEVTRHVVVDLRPPPPPPPPGERTGG